MKSKSILLVNILVIFSLILPASVLPVSAGSETRSAILPAAENPSGQ